MYFKCELAIGGYSYLVTNDLKNWEDITSSFKRNDFDGVIRSFSNKFEFCGEAYHLIKSEYRKNYLSASANVIFYSRNNSWLWNERFRLSLDFSTLVDDGSTISINAIDNSLASLIKAKKGVQYEYSVNEIKEEAQLYYDRLKMKSSVNYTISNARNNNDQPLISIITTQSKYAGINFINFKPEIAVGGFIEYDYEDDFQGKQYKTFVRALKTVELKINARFKTVLNMTNATNFSGANVRLYKVNSSTGELMGGALFTGGYLYGSATPPVEDVINLSVTLYEGESLSFMIQSNFSQPYAYGVATILEHDNPILLFESKGDPVYIDCVNPTTLLNKLLKSMNGGQPGITGTITPLDKRLSECVILPGESVRGLPNAKIYTSYSKFCDWMKAAFGYIPVVGESSVSFVHRDTLFRNKVVKEIENYTDLEYSINNSLIYSRVRVGYEKQDYESVNGRDEFRFSNEYETGVKINDNSLELISPYRADAYGIEFLVQKRGEDTTDNTSDSNVFFVNAIKYGDYRLVRSGYVVSGAISPDTMFNVAYSPRFMIEANKRFIAASVSKLTFASSEGNSDVVINGVKESSDIELSNRLFTVGNLSFETGDLNIPENLNGIVSIKNQGEVYKGYIESVGVNYGRAGAVKYALIVNSALKESTEEKPVNEITMEYISGSLKEKIISSVPVSSEIIVTQCSVETATGIIQSISNVFKIPVGDKSSQSESLVFTRPGFHFEYYLNIDEDDTMKYVLNIK